MLRTMSFVTVTKCKKTISKNKTRTTQNGFVILLQNSSNR